MNTQVITIGPDGSMSGLQRKPGQGLDLRGFGKADIQRASLIEWDAEQQAWFINVVQDAGRGPVTFDKLLASVEDEYGVANLILLLDGTMAKSGWGETTNGIDNRFMRIDRAAPMIFREYDEAVQVEILYLDSLRLQGHY